MKTSSELQAKLLGVWPLLDERTRRLMAANEARALGHGGISEVSRACGLSRKAIAKGIREIEAGTAPPPSRVRQPGAGRKKITAHDPGLMPAMERLIEPETRGDPESPLRWTCKSTRTLAAQLTRQKHPISHMKVAQLLHEQGYSLQGNRKTEEGGDHPDRDAQFRHINTQVRRALAKGTPVISVDTKKKELVGNYENKGRKWLPAKKPVKVQGHDFPHPDVPRAYPYGVYDLERNRGFVNVGTDHDTGLSLSVCHFPPGTSKWNKIEHRLFSFISSNWRGEPLRDYETIVKLISRTATATGLKVTCRLDRRKYPTGRKVTDEEMKHVNIKRHNFHGEWNYTIQPRSS